MLRNSGGARSPRRLSGSGPSRSQRDRRRGMLDAARTRKSLRGAGGTLAAQPGGGCPARAAKSSATPAAVASSVVSRPTGAGTSAHTKPERWASASHCLAASASKLRSARTRSLRSMNGFPKVVEGISCLELAARNQEWLDRTPHFCARPLDLSDYLTPSLEPADPSPSRPAPWEIPHPLAVAFSFKCAGAGSETADSRWPDRPRSHDDRS